MSIRHMELMGHWYVVLGDEIVIKVHSEKEAVRLVAELWGADVLIGNGAETILALEKEMRENR